MLTYDTRSTTFLNLHYLEEVYIPVNDWSGMCDDRDCIFALDITVNSESKIITRTRRKFWDDVSLRGGQYSALMIVLTAIYTLF